MKFKITVPKSLNFTPSGLMKKHAFHNHRYILTHNRYFESYLYDQETGVHYYYDHLLMEENADDTLTVTVFLKEREA